MWAPTLCLVLYSYAIRRFGTPISLDTYEEQFFSGEEGAPRLAVKRLTRAIEGQLIENTINAPDWYVRFGNQVFWVSSH